MKDSIYTPIPTSIVEPIQDRTSKKQIKKGGPLSLVGSGKRRDVRQGTVPKYQG